MEDFILREKLDLVESSQFSGYYHHPVFETIVVSRAGRVIDQRNLFCLLPVLGNTWPYLLINVWGHGTVTLHRTVALTFLTCPGDPDDYMVNHVDGDKENPHVDNLEWTTASENATHAYVSGLRSDNTPVLSKDLETGEIEHYYSLQQAARHFKTNASRVHRFLKGDSLVPWMGKYDLVYEDQPWRPLTKADIGKVAHGQPKGVVAVNRKGAVFRFDSAAGCARYLEINQATLYYHLANHTSTSDGVIACWEEEYSGDLAIAQHIRNNRPHLVGSTFRRKPVPIVVKDLSSGLETDWESVEAFAFSVGTNKNTVQKSMLNKDGHWRGYHIRYVK